MKISQIFARGTNSRNFHARENFSCFCDLPLGSLQNAIALGGVHITLTHLQQAKNYFHTKNSQHSKVIKSLIKETCIHSCT